MLLSAVARANQLTSRNIISDEILKGMLLVNKAPRVVHSKQVLVENLILACERYEVFV